MQSKLILDSGGIRLFQGDAAHLDILEDESVDLVVISPPYNMFGKAGMHIWKPGGYDKCEDALPEDKYQDGQIAVLKELFRVTKSGGALCYNHKIRHRDYETYHPLEWVSKTPWRLIQEIVWERQTTHNHFDGRLWDTTERVYWLYKSVPGKKQPPYFNKECAKYSTVWKIQFEVNSPHPAPFPLTLPYRCIESFSREGELVLDCYVGSGTSAVAAKMLKRRFVGVDISTKYLEDAKLRLEQKTLW